MQRLPRFFATLLALSALLLSACTTPPTSPTSTVATGGNVAPAATGTSGSGTTSPVATNPSAATATTGATAATTATTAATGGATPAATAAGTATGSATAAATATTGTASGPTATTAAQPANGGGTLTAGQIFDVKTLDPHRAYELTTAMVVHNIYDTLVTFTGANFAQVAPSLAESWNASDDLKTYTFKIRSGAKFSSGNPITAEDVRFSLQRLINLKGNASEIAGNFDKISAPDATTVVITLKDPDPAILPLLTSPWLSVVDSKLVKQNGGTDAADADKSDKAENFFNKTSAGSGAFILKSYTPDTEIVLERNQSTWHSMAKLQQVTLKAIPDPSSQKLSVEKGDLDLAFDPTNDQVADSKSKSGIQVITGRPFDFIYLAMNTSADVGKELAKPDVQNAVRMAINYDDLVKLAGGGAMRLNGLVPNGLPGALDTSGLTKTDPEGAKSLLAKAGYPNGISFKLSYPSKQVYDGVPMDTLAEKLQADLKAANINVDLNPVEESPLLDSYRAGKEQAIAIIWGYDLPDPSNALLFAPPDGTIAKRVNWTKPVPEIDALLKGDLNSKDPAKRAAAFQQYQKLMLQISPYVVLFQPGHQLVTRTNVQGVVYNPVWFVDFATVSKPSAVSY